MSRWLENDGCGGYREELANIDECRHLINEVCCCDKSDMCCDFPHPDYCTYICPHFAAEDGKI